VTDWSGGDIDLFHGEVLAANRVIHAAMRKVIDRVPDARRGGGR
jgi:hypothetical protein